MENRADNPRETLERRLLMVQAVLTAHGHRQDVLAAIDTAASEEEAIVRLMRHFGWTNEQALTVSQLRVRDLSSDSRARFEAEAADLQHALRRNT